MPGIDQFIGAVTEAIRNRAVTLRPSLKRNGAAASRSLDGWVGRKAFPPSIRAAPEGTTKDRMTEYDYMVILSTHAETVTGRVGGQPCVALPVGGPQQGAWDPHRFSLELLG